MNEPISEDKVEEIKAAIFAGNKIEAIKLFRAETGKELAEAKDFVEELICELRAKEPEKFTSPSRGCVGVVVLFALVLAAIGLMMSGKQEPAPGDFSAWVTLAADQDWSAKAAQGDPQAQFCRGLILIRTNLVQFAARVPVLSRIPVIGRRFEKISYSIDNNIGQDQMAEAFGWIRKSADQGFAPAKEAEKLFVGRVARSAGRDIAAPR